MAKTGTRRAPAKVMPLEKRLAALEQAVEGLRKIVGDLKYELEQMREE
jgi:uncharacterized coiled-coil protein SlyX